MRAILHGTLVALFFVASQTRASEPIRFSEHLLAGKLGYVFGVAAADLDGDGDLDLTSPDIRNKSHSTLYWFRNDGKGNFERLVIFRDEPGWFERHAIGDINQDGTNDIVCTSEGAADRPGVWWLTRSDDSETDWNWHPVSNHIAGEGIKFDRIGHAG